jgi:hypothetical protein
MPKPLMVIYFIPQRLEFILKIFSTRDVDVSGRFWVHEREIQLFYDNIGDCLSHILPKAVIGRPMHTAPKSRSSDILCEVVQ